MHLQKSRTKALDVLVRQRRRFAARSRDGEDTRQFQHPYPSARRDVHEHVVREEWPFESDGAAIVPAPSAAVERQKKIHAADSQMLRDTLLVARLGVGSIPVARAVLRKIGESSWILRTHFWTRLRLRHLDGVVSLWNSHTKAVRVYGRGVSKHFAEHWAPLLLACTYATSETARTQYRLNFLVYMDII